MSNDSNASKALAQFIANLDSFFSSEPYTAIKDYDNSKNQNLELCAKCGGKCCKKCGCHFSPDDFKEISFDYLSEKIKKGYISIDSIDGDEFWISGNVYFLRVRNKNSPTVDTDRYLSTFPCILFNEQSGCLLSYQNRPSGGKLLIPRSGWGYSTEDLMAMNKLAADTCYWPLYEVVDGKYKITYKPAKKLPVEEFLRPQKRFRHMFKPGNEWMIKEFQEVVDKRWQELLDLEEMTNKVEE